MIETKVDTVLHYTAFTRDPAGGNRAGIVLDAAGWSADEMQRVAAEIGYSETAFVLGERSAGLEVRHFSPAAEAPFCGHASPGGSCHRRRRRVRRLSPPAGLRAAADSVGAKTGGSHETPESPAGRCAGR